MRAFQAWLQTSNSRPVFSKGNCNRNLHFIYAWSEIEIVSQFTYLGIVFSCRGSFKYMFELLNGQATKAIFKLKSYLSKFVDISIKHCLDLFDKLILLAVAQW